MITVSVQYPMPLKSGAIYEYALIGPWPENCPMTSSAKKIGRPMMKTISRYGMRKAPPALFLFDNEN